MNTLNALAFAKSRPSMLRGTREMDNYFTLLERILRQIQEQVGSTTGEVELSIGPMIEQAFVAGVQSIPSQELEVVSTGANYTTFKDSLVVATGACAITLNSAPNDQERVTVQHYATTGQAVTVSGPINDESSMVITVRGDTIDLIYSLSLGRWIIK